MGSSAGEAKRHLPTLTAVLLSSSEALLPLGLLLMLMRLELRFGRIIALKGRGTPFAGEPGGEVAMGCAYGSAVISSGLVRRPVVWDRRFYVLLDSVAQVAGRRVVVKAPVGIRVVLQQQVIRVEAGQRQGRGHKSRGGAIIMEIILLVKTAGKWLGGFTADYQGDKCPLA